MMGCIFYGLRVAGCLVERDETSNRLDIFLHLIDKVCGADPVHDSVIEGERDVDHALHSELAGILVESVVDLTEEQCSNGGRDHDRYGVSEAEALHVG